MDLCLYIENGEILSLVSLPNFDINLRAAVSDKKYEQNNKGIYELGSIFKTLQSLTRKRPVIKTIVMIWIINCSKYKISDLKELPKNLSVEDILIRSSNIGTLLLAREIGEEKFKNF